MTQAALKSSGAAQALSTCTAQAGRDVPKALPSEIKLPLEGLNPEEVELSINAAKFLCVLMESYNMIHAEVADTGNTSREHCCALPAE